MIYSLIGLLRLAAGEVMEYFTRSTLECFPIDISILDLVPYVEHKCHRPKPSFAMLEEHVFTFFRVVKLQVARLCKNN